MEEVSGRDIVIRNVLPRFFIALLISFVGTVMSALFIPTGVAMFISFIPIVVLLGLVVKMVFSKNAGREGLTTYGMRMPMWLVYKFTLFMGVGVYPLLSMYIDSMGMDLVVIAFGTTALLFGALFLYTYFTKRDFTFLGGMLFFALLGAIIFSIVGFFVQSDILQVSVAFFTVMVFSGYMLYDVSRMKDSTFILEDIPSAVFDLYLNFFNLFLSILRIINYFKD